MCHGFLKNRNVDDLLGFYIQGVVRPKVLFDVGQGQLQGAMRYAFDSAAEHLLHELAVAARRGVPQLPCAIAFMAGHAELDPSALGFAYERGKQSDAAGHKLNGTDFMARHGNG